MNKKYYWLKLKDDFFKDRAIKKLRKIAGGDTYTIIYLKLLLLGIKDEGSIYFENIEDNFAEEIALELDEDAENVKVTLLFLEKVGLLENVSKEEILLTETKNITGSETQGAERVRRCREKKQALLCNTDVTEGSAPVAISNTEIEKEIELDKDIPPNPQGDEEDEKSNSKINYQSILNAYNNANSNHGSKLPHGKALTDKRRRNIKKFLSQLKDPNVETVEKYFNAFFKNARPFYFGEAEDDWKADFDYVIRPDTVLKVREKSL